MTTMAPPQASTTRTDWSALARELGAALRRPRRRARRRRFVRRRELRRAEDAPPVLRRRAHRARRRRRVTRGAVRDAPRARPLVRLDRARALHAHAPGGGRRAGGARTTARRSRGCCAASRPRSWCSSAAAARTGWPARARRGRSRAAIASTPARSSPAAARRASSWSTSAVLDDPQAGPTVLHFPVPLNAPGVTIQDTWHTLGMRGTGSHDVVLDDVFVPDAAVAGRRPQGQWHHLFHVIAMIALPLIYAAVRRRRGGRARPRRAPGAEEGATTRAWPCWSARWRTSWPPRRWRSTR